ncbi:MAG TPA: response regulator transcription factor [Actinocrinis sp.]|nr:response regulator transcription factor [Actinocrinis sp.]
MPTPTSTPIRVVVADDQELVRSGLAMILDTQPDIEVVAEAANGLEAVEAVRATSPDVALLDVRMPELDGLEAARRICAAHTCRVVMLTTFDIDAYVYAALQAGASGFLLKDVRRDDLIQAVRVVAGGEALLAPTVTKRLIERFTQSQSHTQAQSRTPPQSQPQAQPLPQPTRAPALALAQLTARERETLRLLARGCSNAEIAAQFVVSEHTVKTHVSNVLTKLHLRDRIHAVVFAYESGLVVPGE